MTTCSIYDGGGDSQSNLVSQFYENLSLIGNGSARLGAVPFAMFVRLATVLPFLCAGYAAAEPPDCGLYAYKADIVRVIDGDTVVVNIDLGFNIWLHNEHLRLVGIDAPEQRSEAGDRTTDALQARIEGKSVYICTMKAKRSDKEATGSFGRYLVEIFENGESVNDWLIASGLAVSYDR